MVVDLLGDEDADLVFRALADRTRRDILRRAGRQELSVSMLAREYSMSFAAVQKHVAMLERARLVVKRRHGRERLVRSDPERLRQAGELLDRFELIWRERSERISALIGEEETDE